MDIQNKATRIELLNFKTPQMRAFHMTWFAFFLCFFGWFGVAPLMAVIREDLGLTKTQIGDTIIASVAATIFARLLIGWLCDRVGPRLTYSWLLILGAFPIMGVGLARNYETFLLFRLVIGVVGASFVVTQCHTSIMFAQNCVGAANATTAGWGNLGGGVTQMAMPLVLMGALQLGGGPHMGWRLAMVLPGSALLFVGVAYYFLTQDAPEGNFKELRAKGLESPDAQNGSAFLDATKDIRVWALFFLYAACFGIELTINNVAAIYFMDSFHLDLKTAGLIAGLFGLMNVFARTLGGVFGDRMGLRYGLNGRSIFLGIAILGEGVALIIFSRMTALGWAAVALIVFSLFVQMSEGATYSVVPFINRKALGSVAGIVGAGGNAGAVAAGFLFRSESLSYSAAFLILGALVLASSVLSLAVRFSPEAVRAARRDLERELCGSAPQPAYQST